MKKGRSLKKERERTLRFPHVVSGTMLKGIAALSMLISHLCLIIIGFLPYAEYLSLPVLGYTILASIGRIAFPLFCFTAVEGFLHYIFYPAHLLIIGYIAARLPAVLQ